MDLIQMSKTVRCDILNMVHKAGSGHPGGSLSATDLMVGLYFGGIMRIDPARPDWEDRDRFLLSKGHAAPVLYSVLARKGFFPVEELWTLRRLGSILQGHPHKESTPGLDCSSGSLGQGLSIADGLAFGFKKQGHEMEQILRAYEMAAAFKGKPSVLIANTVKGKGVSFMEGDCAWHGTAPNAEQLERALREIREEAEA